MNKNLLELCLSPDLGGLELYMVRAAKALNESMNVLSVIAEKTKLKQYYDDPQYSCKQIRRNRSFSFSAAKQLAKVIDENDIDVIHMHWTKDLPIAVMAKVLSKKKPKLVQTRNMTMTRFKDDFYHRFLYKHMDMIMPVTHQVAEQINTFIPQDIRPKVEVLYMGSEEPELLSQDEITAYKKEINVEQDIFLIGMVGRIEESKGQYLLIEAMQRLKKRDLRLQVCFVGHAMEESYQKELDEMIASKGLGNEISFLGFTNNPHRFMQACDCVILATPCETFGLVVIEAMQMQTPVIATNKCGPLEIIEDGVSGLLFEENNSDDLALKIQYLCENPQEHEKISKEAKKVAGERFSNRQQFQKLGQILKKMES